MKKKYQRHLKNVVTDLKKLPDTDTAIWINVHKGELKDFSPLNWHLLEQVKKFIFLSEESPFLQSGEFGEREETVFEMWNNSEFADVFLKNLNKGQSLKKASLSTLKTLDKHLVVFAERHVLKNHKTSSHYRFQPSLGEVKKENKITRLLEACLHIEGKELLLLTSSLKEMKDFSKKIEAALKVIRKHSPSSWERFSAFTEVIIPIKEPELVSFSHQDLPGFSMINLYHRDFVDLMDDLLHENGHHHLNYYLNLGTLIEEPLENIYYSPWRRTLRPLRGIYHAYFTFFWAFKLFADLAKAKEVDSIFYLFSKSEKEKILWRAVEEFYMLSYTFEDLKWARKKGLIHENGWALVEEQQKELNKFKKIVPAWEKKLTAHKKDLSALKKTLKKAGEDFAKN